MKTSTIKPVLQQLSVLAFLLITVFFCACEKDQHVKPVPGKFEVNHDFPTLVPAAGATYTLTIDATTNAWWIETAADASWVNVARKYGSAKVTQQIKVATNATGAAREMTIKINATNQESTSIIVKQAK